MPTRGTPEKKFAKILKDKASGLNQDHLDYIDEYQLWLSSKQEKRLEFVINELLDLAAELE
mgnify:CR=1 FL=1